MRNSAEFSINHNYTTPPWNQDQSTRSNGGKDDSIQTCILKTWDANHNIFYRHTGKLPWSIQSGSWRIVESLIYALDIAPFASILSYLAPASSGRCTVSVEVVLPVATTHFKSCEYVNTRNTRTRQNWARWEQMRRIQAMSGPLEVPQRNAASRLTYVCIVTPHKWCGVTILRQRHLKLCQMSFALRKNYRP